MKKPSPLLRPSHPLGNSWPNICWELGTTEKSFTSLKKINSRELRIENLMINVFSMSVSSCKKL